MNFKKKLVKIHLLVHEFAFNSSKTMNGSVVFADWFLGNDSNSKQKYIQNENNPINRLN